MILVVGLHMCNHAHTMTIIVLTVYAAQDQTCVSNQSLLVTTSSGYLANIITDEMGKGSQSCPWRFRPDPGQTVHLTLLDFGVWIDRADRDRRNICRIYATIKEIGTAHQKSDTLVCGGVQREKFIMSTDTEITIAVMRQENTVNDTAYFFIKYQGNATCTYKSVHLMRYFILCAYLLVARG